MILKSFIYGLILTAGTTATQAALVNIAANSFAGTAPKMLTTTAGLPLALGSVVRLGTFPAGAPTITAATTFAQLNALFVPIGETAGADDGTNGPLTINDTNPVNPAATRGSFGGTINAVQNTNASFAAATRIYMMVLDVPFTNMAAATQWAILSDAVTWTIPATATRTLTTSQIDVADAFAGVVLPTEIRLAPIIPEPSTGLMALLAGLGLVARRRR